MPMQEALAPHDQPAIRLVSVPDVWPPLDCPAAEAAELCPRPIGSAEHGGVWPRQFAVLLAETLTGDRPVRQILPWLSKRGSVHLHRLLPLFRGGHRPRIQRVMTAQPTPDVIEMTLIVTVGPRTRALAVRLARAEPTRRPAWQENRWLCTDIEAA